MLDRAGFEILDVMTLRADFLTLARRHSDAGLASHPRAGGASRVSVVVFEQLPLSPMRAEIRLYRRMSDLLRIAAISSDDLPRVLRVPSG